MKLHIAVAAAALALLVAFKGNAAAESKTEAAPKVLRYSFRVAETGFDPA